MMLFREEVGRTGVGHGVVEQRLDGRFQPLVENRPGLGIEFAAKTPHPGLVVDPRAQSGVAPLTFESGDAVVLLSPTDLLA